MVGGIALLFLLYIVSQGIFSSLKRKHSFFSEKLMKKLFFYHFIFFFIYYIRGLYNPTDSRGYYNRTLISESWLSLFGTGTTFIDFISWPFIHVLGFNYEMMMVLFCWFGFLGFIYAYLFFKDNIPIQIRMFNFDFLALLLFLPNMHFWTASFGKGAPIFMGLMMFAYAIQNPKRRWGTLLIGIFIVYFIRPHVLLFIAVGTFLGYMTGKESISFGRKILIYVGIIGLLIFTQETIMGMAGLNESEDVLSDFSEFADTRASNLAQADSGVDIASYPLPLKLFTFWFRPLFFDSPGVLGLFVSLENLVYLLIFFKILKIDFIKFLLKSPVSVKISLTIFLLSSIALSFVTSNLGIIIRQKSMVMYFLFFVIYYYLAQNKYDRIIKMRKLKARNIKDIEVVV